MNFLPFWFWLVQVGMLENYARQEGLKAVFFDLEQLQILADFNRSDKEIGQLICQSGEVVFIDEFVTV